MHSQRKPVRQSAPTSRPVARPEYTAAVRYLDGTRDIFRVRNADDIDDARALVISELGDLRSLVIAPRN